MRSRTLRHRARAATRARDLARGPGDGPTERLDLRRGESGAQPGDADRGLRAAIRAEDRAPDADHAFGRLLEIHGIAPPANGGELALQARDGRNRVLRPRQKHPGAVKPIDLVVGKKASIAFPSEVQYAGSRLPMSVITCGSPSLRLES